VTSELVRSDSRTTPGGVVTYSVWFWSTVKARHVTASVSSYGKFVEDQSLSLCPATNGGVCSVGELPANQQFEVLVTDKIGKNASAGEQIGITVNVQGQTDTGGTLSPAEASVATVLNHPGSSPTSPIGTEPPPGTIPPPANPEPGLPQPGTTVTPGSISSLFPVVTPSSSPPSSSSKSSSGQKKHGGTKVTTVASSSPIDTKLIGGQLAGLAVLAAAITMVVARLSLRTPQTAAAAAPTGAGAPPPEDGETVPDAESAPKGSSEAAAES
jgi:hypothetical protein